MISGFINSYRILFQILMHHLRDYLYWKRNWTRHSRIESREAIVLRVIIKSVSMRAISSNRICRIIIIMQHLRLSLSLSLDLRRNSYNFIISKCRVSVWSIRLCLDPQDSKCPCETDYVPGLAKLLLLNFIISTTFNTAVDSVVRAR